MLESKSGLIALDLGLSLGWAVRTPAGAIFSGCHRIQAQDEGLYGARFPALRSFLAPIFTGWSPGSVIAYERVQGGMKNDDAALTQVGMRCGVLELVATHGWPVPKSIVPCSLKKWATGKGTATKPAMVARAQEWWKVRDLDHNQADALMVLAWAMRNAKLEATAPARANQPRLVWADAEGE